MSHPQILGKYQIKRVLGEGAMGTVYRGFDPDIERHVAIKTLHSSLSQGVSGKQYLERFRREAQIAAQCVHPNIVMVLEYGRIDQTPFIVMEYVDGMSLAQLLQKQEKVSVKNAVSIAMAVLQALTAASRVGIVHRDIKPANIMITRKGKIKLADFGIARISQNDEMTAVGAVLGTPKYMSPEQMAGAEVDFRSDLYSLALVLIELLSRSRVERSIPLMQLTTLDPSIVKKMGPQKRIPSAFVPLLEQALKHDPQRRFSSPQAFIKALKLGVKTSADDLRNSGRHHTANIQSHITASGTQFSFAHHGLETLVDPNASFVPLDEKTISSMEAELAQHIGDVAKGMVRKELDMAISLAEMVRTLGLKIPKASARKQFIARWTQ